MNDLRHKYFFLSLSFLPYTLSFLFPSFSNTSSFIPYLFYIYFSYLHTFLLFRTNLAVFRSSGEIVTALVPFMQIHFSNLYQKIGWFVCLSSFLDYLQKMYELIIAQTYIIALNCFVRNVPCITRL